MNTSVRFKSTRFRPILPEECQVNPGRYGGELAFWLCGELARKGVTTSYPDYEDWGWFLEYTNPEGNDFWLCCGNVEGSEDKWFCFLEPQSRGFFGSKTAGPERAQALLEAMARVLDAEESVHDVVWSTA
jgi:hypothetical protein